jgi:hypothetical protein
LPDGSTKGWREAKALSGLLLFKETEYIILDLFHIV